MQLIIVTSIYLFVASTTLYYGVIYMFLVILVLSIFLAYYNLEVLTGFLLVVELTVLFILILFLLALNFEGKPANTNKSLFLMSAVSLFLFLFFLFGFSKPASVDFLNAAHYWTDYYAALEDDVMNDIFGLYLSYYFFNSFLFFIFGIIILVASLSCINLFRTLKIESQYKAVSLQFVVNFFKDLTMFDFIRKQVMNQQSRRKSTTRLVKNNKKNKNVAKK